ncbi:hypothetical protein CPLU01_15196 [Colletotrichum plurivorum]|uniref:Uncharacterized protein n=1 Tax=Colletotrichum plurivorum TaxID=2175906 RepID=A0A8H6JDB8_9PEZI|nr:hypothetical protein CPLU01_15196 [Colletotrichum plurivorum]
MGLSSIEVRNAEPSDVDDLALQKCSIGRSKGRGPGFAELSSLPKANLYTSISATPALSKGSGARPQIPHKQLPGDPGGS